MFIKPPFFDETWILLSRESMKFSKRDKQEGVQEATKRQHTKFHHSKLSRFMSGGEWPPVFHWSPNTIGYISQESNDWHVLWESNHFVSGFSLNRSSVPASDCPEVCLHWYSSSAIKRRKTYCSAWMQWSRFLDCWRPKQVIYSSCHILLFSRLCMATELLCYVGSLHSIENWA